jgi:aminoglycoside phosphotransferase (APT) family kinase protein
VSLVYLHDGQGGGRWHGSKEVYRVSAGADTYVVHLTPHSRDELLHLRKNLDFLSQLADQRIPRVLAWRDSGPSPAGRAWALMVCPEIPGAELGPANYSPSVWADLCNLLLSVHALPAEGDLFPKGACADHANSFRDFAEALLLRLEDLPLKSARVRAHLDEMADYVVANLPDFQVTPRVIHGELNRANLLVHDDRAALIDWAEMTAGDYLYDLATLKFSMDSVVPSLSAQLLRKQAEAYRQRFADEALELRMRFFLALPGLVHAYEYAGQTALFPAARAWRVRTCYLHSEAQWRSPLRLDGAATGAPAARTPHWPDEMPVQIRGLYYLVAPKRVS